MKKDLMERFVITQERIAQEFMRRTETDKKWFELQERWRAEDLERLAKQRSEDLALVAKYRVEDQAERGRPPLFTSTPIPVPSHELPSGGS